MPTHLLILGGTLEATALAQRLSELPVRTTISLAGRVLTPKAQAVPTRVGGFGGISGLIDYLEAQKVTHVIDATHPFAAQMSQHAVAACKEISIPLVGLSRAPWHPQTGDQWTEVRDIPAAVAALEVPACTVFLAIGRMHLESFLPQSHHAYVIRLVDPPAEAPPFPRLTTIIDRGPFTVEDDLALIKQHGIDLIVSKNSGGTGAVAKISAARALGMPVIMINRPDTPGRPTVDTVDAACAWLVDHGADLGV